jgi:alcohol dehydrogenase class IV
MEKLNVPTEVLCGRDVILKNANKFKTIGTKAFIVSGKHSALKNGSLDDALKALKSEKIEYVLFNEVMANPTIPLVYEGSKKLKENGCDFVIAIGGGSPMDAAKAIAILARQDIKESDLFSASISSDVLPIVCIPTTSGTGSEVTPYSIITNDRLETKSTINSIYTYPTLAFLDGKYTETLGRNTTINTVLDALCHAIEGYLSKKATAYSKALSLKAIKMISKHFKELENNTLSIEARDELLYASTLAGVVIASCGTVAVHILGYSLTYYKDIDHGRANGLLLVEFLRLVQTKEKVLVEEILESLNMSSLDELDKELNILLGEKETISDSEIEKYAIKASKVEKLKNTIIDLSLEDLKDILKKSLKG